MKMLITWKRKWSLEMERICLFSPEIIHRATSKSLKFHQKYYKAGVSNMPRDNARMDRRWEGSKFPGRFNVEERTGCIETAEGFQSYHLRIEEGLWFGIWRLRCILHRTLEKLKMLPPPDPLRLALGLSWSPKTGSGASTGILHHTICVLRLQCTLGTGYGLLTFNISRPSEVPGSD